MTSLERLEQRIVLLEAENVRLRQENKELRQEVQELRRLLKSIVEPEKKLPSFVKEDTPHRNKRPGREEGHEGASRPMPEHIDETKEATICCCPECSGKVTFIDNRDRIIEDVIPAEVKVTKVEVGRYWCNGCKKIVEAPVTEAFPGCRFGLRLYLLTTFLRMRLGMTMEKIQTLLQMSYGLKISKGGISQMLARTALEFGGHYAQLIDDLRSSPYANCDETGWRIDGKNAWLWDFIGRMVAVYIIHRSRGRNVPRKILGKDYGGTVGSDFWSAYNFASDSQQKCHVHLKRNLRDTAKKKHHRSSFYPFKKKLKRILDDSLRIWKREP
ncbi:transposase, partial [Candidatus Micrarchaeota archaeon]|nr:transposase [Candidatus Micrarchaeota archaeon]